MLHLGAWIFPGGGYLSRGAGMYCIFSSYGPVNAVSKYMYPIRHSQFSGKNGLGCPMGYLGWMHAWVQDCTDRRVAAGAGGFAVFLGITKQNL